LRALESKRTSGGSYKISAAGNQHDDYATTLALLAFKIADSVPKEPWSFVVGVPAPQAPSLANPHPGYDRWGNKDRYADLAPGDPGPERWWQRL
jgi:hypothetical protein